MPNQLGIDAFDLDDAFTIQENHMCSVDMREFIANNHLNLSMDGSLNPREAFGSHDDADHVYNTPRAWYIDVYKRQIIYYISKKYMKYIQRNFL